MKYPQPPAWAIKIARVLVQRPESITTTPKVRMVLHPPLLTRPGRDSLREAQTTHNAETMVPKWWKAFHAREKLDARELFDPSTGHALFLLVWHTIGLLFCASFPWAVLVLIAAWLNDGHMPTNAHRAHILWWVIYASLLCVGLARSWQWYAITILSLRRGRTRWDQEPSSVSFCEAVNRLEREFRQEDLADITRREDVITRAHVELKNIRDGGHRRVSRLETDASVIPGSITEEARAELHRQIEKTRTFIQEVEALITPYEEAIARIEAADRAFMSLFDQYLRFLRDLPQKEHPLIETQLQREDERLRKAAFDALETLERTLTRAEIKHETLQRTAASESVHAPAEDTVPATTPSARKKRRRHK